MKDKGTMTGAQFKEMRESLGMSSTQLAAAIGCTYSTIRNIEHSDRVKKIFEVGILHVKATSIAEKN